MNKKVEINFSLHIPYVLKNYKVFDIDKNLNLEYFDENKTNEMCKSFAEKSYFEVNRILYNLVKIHKNKFKFSLTISGVSIEILKKFNPHLLETFKKLISTGKVELKSSFYHSLEIPKISTKRINQEIEEHSKIIEETFGIKPFGFTNNFEKINEFPLEAKEFAKSILDKNKISSKISFNYNYFGIENNFDSGVFEFLKHMPNSFLKEDCEFENSFEIINPENIPCENHNNQMQESISNHINNLEELVLKTNNCEFIENWKKLSNSHFISNLDFKNFKSNANSLTDFQSPYDLYINLKNIIEDLNLKLIQFFENINSPQKLVSTI